jgi:hypothetical protein
MAAANRQSNEKRIETDLMSMKMSDKPLYHLSQWSLMPISGHGKMYVCRTNEILPFHSGVVSGELKS